MILGVTTFAECPLATVPYRTVPPSHPVWPSMITGIKPVALDVELGLPSLQLLTRVSPLSVVTGRGVVLDVRPVRVDATVVRPSTKAIRNPSLEDMIKALSGLLE